MAKQCGPILFEGSLGNVTGYQVNGRFYIKRKSGVARKRILTSERFANTRRNANWFGKAQKIASLIYRENRRQTMDHGPRVSPQTIDHGPRVDSRTIDHGPRLWYRLRNRAQELVRKELPETEILDILRKEFVYPLENKLNPKPSTPILPPGEIFLGRTINSQLIPDLIDQLSAGRAMIQNLVGEKNKMSSAFIKERVMLERVLKKFRY
jgi:hypothetical protein